MKTQHVTCVRRRKAGRGGMLGALLLVVASAAAWLGVAGCERASAPGDHAEVRPALEEPVSSRREPALVGAPPVMQDLGFRRIPRGWRVLEGGEPEVRIGLGDGRTILFFWDPDVETMRDEIRNQAALAIKNMSNPALSAEAYMQQYTNLRALFGAMAQLPSGDVGKGGAPLSLAEQRVYVTAIVCKLLGGGRIPTYVRCSSLEGWFFPRVLPDGRSWCEGPVFEATKGECVGYMMLRGSMSEEDMLGAAVELLWALDESRKAAGPVGAPNPGESDG